MKFSALLHGADPKDLEGKELSPEVARENLLFGDPADYAKMSDEDRKDLSDKMKKKFMTWAGAKKNG
jgi:hypothetical protein